MAALKFTQEDYWNKLGPDHLRQAGNEFRNIRRQTKKRHQQERQVEVLSALDSRRGDMTPGTVPSNRFTT